ncbi:MAG: DUF3568 family protein [Candidatus Omnitrophica bacterium]|nr:DUF3568 family protein [Candidatus Omnitrophota bacterium]
MIRTKFKVFIMLLFCSLAFSGCIFVVAGVGALGGYAISKDTIQGETDKTFESVWDASLRVLNILGTVSSEDKQKGMIEAEIDTSNTKVTIEQLTPKTVRLVVTARRFLMPDITLAQKIYIKVIENAK